MKSNTLLLVIILVFGAKHLSMAQATVQINGSQVVCRGEATSYGVSVNASYNKVSWSVSGGTINGSSTSSSVSVTWGPGGGGSVMVAVLYDFSFIGNALLVVNNISLPPVTAPALACSPGATVRISTPSCPGFSGTLKTFKWQTRLTGQSAWQDVTSYSTTTLYIDYVMTQSREFRYITSCLAENASNVVQVGVATPLDGGQIAGTSTICYNTAPAALTSSSLPTGGDGNYTYQWQQSLNNTLWTYISGASGSAYSPGNLTATTYFRRVAFSGCGTIAATPGVQITVTPSVNPGVLAGKTPLLSGTRAGTSIPAASGGNGTYTYQWESSTDNITWSPISGATSANYNPVVTASLWLRRKVISCGEVKYSNPLYFAVFLPYIRVTDFRRSGIAEATVVTSLPAGAYLQNTTFFDGLCRPMQHVSKGSSPTAQRDVVVPRVYDNLGRESIKYLPYVSTQNNGWYKPSLVETSSGNYTGSAHYNFYNNGAADRVADDTKPYAVTLFEPSPLNRPREHGAAGASFQPDPASTYASVQPNDRSLKTSYETNAANEVLLWTYSYPSNASSSLFGQVNAGTASAPVYYAADQLIRLRTKDENNNEVIEYADKAGRPILKRVQAVAGTPSTTDAGKDVNFASTYYIHDDYGNLVCVIPPEAVSRLATEYFHAAATNATKESFMKRWAFRYKHDMRKRMVSKQVPGAGQVFMVYDDRDRLVLTQDSLQRTATPKQWLFTKYDELNRPIATGIKDTALLLTQVQMQAAVDAHYVKPWSRWGEVYVGSAAGNLHGYSNKSYPVITGPTTTIDPNRYLTVAYYDSYVFLDEWPELYDYLDENLSEASNGITYYQPDTQHPKVLGLVTATKTKVLDGGITGGYSWLKKVNYYDNRYRVIQTIEDNYVGGRDRLTSVVDFPGKILETKHSHATDNVLWKDHVAATQVGNKLMSVAGSNGWGLSGAVSTQQLPAGQDGWMEVTVSETNTNRMIGLADTNPDASYTGIDYAFYLNASTISIRENGAAKVTFPGTASPGDILRIERNGTTITYRWKTNTYTSTVASSTMLMVDASLNTNGSTLVNVRTSFSAGSKNITRRYEYDPVGRLKKTFHQLGTEPEVLLSQNDYNAISQLVDKKLHSVGGSAPMQSVDYRYNIRGWLTSINNAALTNDGIANDDTGDYFGMNVAYNTDLGIGNTPQYNGNISAVTWSKNMGLGDITQNAYSYAYDPMKRLLSASHKALTVSSTWAAGQYDENGLTYDLNGNIRHLERKGKGGELIDNLTYYYGVGATASNKLLYVQDNTSNPNGFTDGNTGTATDYIYNVNGSMTRDLNKGIGTSGTDATNLVTYNFLNLPETVTKGGSNIRYIYSAAGLKLSQVVTSGTAVKRTDYAGGMEYENNILQYIHHDEGRIVVSMNQPVYANNCDAVTTDMTAIDATLLPYTNNAEKYITAESTGTTAGSGIFPIGGTKVVVAGERYRIRAKGYRGTNTAYLQVKAGGLLLNSTGAILPNSARTETWLEQIVTIPEGATTLQAGIVWGATVTAGEIIYLNEFEITKLEETAPEYQYDLKDHLGNVRVTFTAKLQTTTSYTTDFESTSNPDFRNYSSQTFDLVDHTDAGTTYKKVQTLNGGANGRVGLAKSFPVGPGDEVNVTAYGKYMNLGTAANATPLINALASAFGVSSSSTGEKQLIYNGLNSYAGTVAGGDHYDDHEDAPKAFVTILFFDKDYNLVDAAWDQMTTTGVQTSASVKQPPHDELSVTAKAPEAGYAYVFLSNEHPYYVDVYFDDATVRHTPSAIVGVDDYYPFGLTFNSYQRTNTIGGWDKFNEMEEQSDLSLNLLQASFRTYDPVLGRFQQVDPLAIGLRDFSPYHFSYNNPVRFVDPSGLAGETRGADGFTTEEWIAFSRPGGPTEDEIARIDQNRKNERENNAGPRITVDGKEITDGDAEVLRIVDGRYIHIFYASYFFGPQSGGWTPLTKKDLEQYANSIGLCTNCTANQLGALFETIFDRYARIQPALIESQFARNIFPMPFSGRNTVPDFTASARIWDEKGVLKAVIPLGVWFEVKAMANDLYLSSNTGQVKGHLDNLISFSQTTRVLFPDWIPVLHIITTAEVNVSKGIMQYAPNMVEVQHHVAHFRIQNGQYQFIFPNK